MSMCIHLYIYIYKLACTYIQKDNSKIINNEIVWYNYDKIRKGGKENEKISQKTVGSMRDDIFKETFTLLVIYKLICEVLAHNCLIH